MEANTILFADRSYHLSEAKVLGLTNIELIALSACQTAKETSENGEQIPGLAYIFERAGAKAVSGTPPLKGGACADRIGAVIASLWNANDETTRDIMVEFYRQLAQGKTKSEALRQAKLKYINNYDSPFVWSHLVLIGN